MAPDQHQYIASRPLTPQDETAKESQNKAHGEPGQEVTSIREPLESGSQETEFPEEAALRVAHVDECPVIGLSEEDEAFYNGFSKAQRKTIRNKIDLRLLPVLGLLYLVAQLDRANIGNAKIEGLKEDIHITDTQYNIILALFFLPYCLLEIPSNMILRQIKKPSLYLGGLVSSWGIVMTCHAFAHNFGDLAALRFLLGTAEAGFFPGAMYLCSQWYRPHELATRLSLFMVISAASGIVSGLLAAAITKLDGTLGYEGWRWIFLIEGCVTIALGATTWLALVDTPVRSTRWLDLDEIRYLQIQNLIKKGGQRAVQGERHSKRKDLWHVVRQARYWAFGFIFYAGGACGYGLKFSIPSIVRGMGYTKSKAQLMSTIPYILAVFSAVGAAVGSDKAACRSAFVICCFKLILCGLAVVVPLSSKPEDHKTLIMVGLCLATAGVLPLAPTGGSWVSNNIRSARRRAIGLAFTMALGSVGGMTGSFLYVESEAPVFTTGYLSSSVLGTFGFLTAVGLLAFFLHQNHKRAQQSEAQTREKYTEQELLDLGEESPLFRYTL